MSFSVLAYRACVLSISSFPELHQRSCCYLPPRTVRFKPLSRKIRNLIIHNASIIYCRGRLRDADILKAPKLRGVGSTDNSGGSALLFAYLRLGEIVSEHALLAKLCLALVVAAAITFRSLCLGKHSLDRSLPLVDGLSSLATASTGDFSVSVSGYKIVLPQYAPGYIYFWLLMAAACGLFVSEEALNIWVGTSLAQKLSLDGTWRSFLESLSCNLQYIISTVFWLYWGVCISDMIPFYLGKILRKSKAPEDVCSKLGIGEEKAARITQTVQKYGNLIGVVERFSIGARNPTAVVAGMLGISAERFFGGVCIGGIITLAIQLGLGFLFRKEPLTAVASVATAVGIWSVLPYLVAGSTAFFLYLHQKYNHA